MNSGKHVVVSLPVKQRQELSDRERWASRISERWQASVEAIIDVGRMLIQAKAELAHGEFGAMCEGELPFSARTAQRLMSISHDRRLTNATHASVLPPSWYTLYELTKLDDDTLTCAIDSGAIHTEMQRKDATLLLNESRRVCKVQAATTECTPQTCTTEDLRTLHARGMTFGTIYADPPWLYSNQGTRAATGNHYGGMTVEEIADLPVEQLAADNAHLHLWTTNAFLFDCKDIMTAWGFTYKSCFVWAKPQMGIGNYWRVSHEFLLLGVRGKCPFLDRGQMSWITEERTKHSAKPERIRAIIERVSPSPRLELFARRTAPGWVSWGNEIELNLFDAGVEAIA